MLAYIFFQLFYSHLSSGQSLVLSVMMAAGCCGVKKQKLNNAVANSVCYNGMNGNAPGSSGCSRPIKQANRVVSKEMCVYCFEVLASYLFGSETPKPPKFKNEECPLFVTWKIGKEKKLRGCIGTFNVTSLHSGLREYAITSACKDSRFEPIMRDEFARLHCSVSLLMDFESAESYSDWEIGMHGIRIEFTNDKGSRKAATYLPEVAVEQGWSQTETVDSLLRKGGYKSSITPDVRCQISLTRFQAEKVTISYQEYVLHANQHRANGHSLVRHNGLLNGALHSHRRSTASEAPSPYRLCKSGSRSASTSRRQSPSGHHTPHHVATLHTQHCTLGEHAQLAASHAAAAAVSASNPALAVGAPIANQHHYFTREYERQLLAQHGCMNGGLMPADGDAMLDDSQSYHSTNPNLGNDYSH